MRLGHVTIVLGAMLMLMTGADEAPQPAAPATAPAARPGDDFSRTAIDVGLVVRDIERSVSWYRDVIGLKPLTTIDIEADFSGHAGLTDYKLFRVHVLALGEAAEAAKLKLMQIPETEPATCPSEFIHSAYGIRYLTIFVKDLTAALRRAADAGARPLVNGPVRFPEELGDHNWLACLRDPDGNIVELIGPVRKP